jgi:hypothetical protein
MNCLSVLQIWVHATYRCHICVFVPLYGPDIHLLLMQIKAIHTSGGSHFSQCKICGRQSGTGALFFQVLLFSSAITILPMFHIHIS